MPKIPKAILFDADGTLYNSERLHYESNRLTALELHNFELTWEEFNANVRRGNTSTHLIVAKHVDNVNYEKFVAKKHEHYSRLASGELTTMPGLIEFLTWCEDQNIRRIIVSAARRHAVEISLGLLELDRFFEQIVTRDDVDDQERKPHPFPYVLALETAGIKAQDALAVEDTDKGINSAVGAGLFCVGFSGSENTPEELARANLIIQDYGELKDYLLR